MSRHECPIWQALPDEQLTTRQVSLGPDRNAEIATKAYEAAGEGPKGPTGGGPAGGAPGGAPGGQQKRQDDVIDAEFEEGN